jgi:hypothetical protein
MNIKSLASHVKQGTVAKLLTAGLLAGAFALALPGRADAQQAVVFVGTPHPVFARYERDRRFDYDRVRAEQFRREEWRHDQRFHRSHFDHERRFYR